MALIGTLAPRVGSQTAAHYADSQKGKLLALHTCDACHIVSPGQELAPLIAGYGPSFSDIANRPGTTAQSLQAFLAHSHRYGNMPFPSLSSAQMADVIAYIIALKGHN